MNDKNLNFDPLIFIKLIIQHKNLFVKTCFLFLAFGIIYSISLPNVYKSSLIFAPKVSSEDKTTSSIASIAGLAGIDLSSSPNNISPVSYPEIFNDIFFKREVLQIKIRDSLTLYDYIENNYSPSIFQKASKFIFSMPSRLFNLNNKLKNNTDYIYLDKIYIISNSESEVLDKLNELINIDVNEKYLTVELSSSLKNPNYSTIVTQGLFKILQKYIINFNIKSSKDLLDFNIKNLETKKIEYENALDRLARFTDENQNISSTKYLNELSKYQNEVNLLFSVYSELSQNVEKSKIQVTKDTPVFTLYKNAEVPIKRSSPNRSIIVFAFLFIGILTVFLYISLKDPFKIILKELS